jgi:hypothetical protein
MQISKRYAIPSLLLLIAMFLPWFSVNAIFTTMTIAGYRLGAAGVFLLLLSVAGVVCAFVKNPRTQAIFAGIVGLLTIIFVWVANNSVYSKASQFGSLGTLVSNTVLSHSFGFYLACSMGIGLLAISVYSYLTMSSTPNEETTGTRLHLNAVPKLNVQLPIQKLREIKVTSIPLNNTKSRIAFGAGGVVVLYLLALWIWNANHSPSSTVAAFSNALASGDTSKVRSMLDEGKSVPDWEVQDFVHYYSNNSGSLHNLLAPLNPQNGSLDAFIASFIGGSNNTISLIKHNFLGFASYGVHIQPVSYSLSGPQGVSFTVGGQSIPASGTLLPGQYDVTATVSSPLGSVTDTETVDTTSGSSAQLSFEFSKDMLDIRSDIKGPVTVLVDGKTFGTMNLQGPDTDNYLGPLPLDRVSNVTVQAKEPWGVFSESGSDVQNGQVSLSPDENDAALASTLANVINRFNLQDTIDQSTGNYKPELQYLVPDGPAYQQISSRNGAGSKMTYEGMNYSPTQLMLDTFGDNSVIGVDINDSEFYNTNGNRSEVDWVYKMEYDPSTQKWLIYDITSNGSNHIDANAPNVHLNPPQ